MIRLIHIATIFIFTLNLVSCVPTKTKQQIESAVLQNDVNKKYNKVISDSTNELIATVENLNVEYTIWGCACPNWILSEDNESNDTTKNYLSLHFYLEPAKESLEIPIYFDANRHRLEITGQFYKREDYPQGTVEMEEPMPKAKVFRYSSIKVVDKANFKPDNEIETLTLKYNALSCTCAQWSETAEGNNIEKKANYWLEPASAELLKSNTLFKGNNLPLVIKLTGQVVSENGFPKRENLSKVDNDESGVVFRYTKIDVLQNGQK